MIRQYVQPGKDVHFLLQVVGDHFVGPGCLGAVWAGNDLSFVPRCNPTVASTVQTVVVAGTADVLLSCAPVSVSVAVTFSTHAVFLSPCSLFGFFFPQGTTRRLVLLSSHCTVLLFVFRIQYTHFWCDRHAAPHS